MRRALGPILGCLGLLVLAGCRHRDLVEAELRYQNRQVRELKRRLDHKEAEVFTLQGIMQQSCGSPEACATGDTPETVYRREAMSSVSLGMSTGPRDVDRDGTPEAVQFSVVCRDYDGDAFKCPGSAKVELVAVQESGVLAPIAAWQIEGEDLRQTWKTSPLSSGYQIVVPAPMLDQSRKWRAVVSFQTLDGRVFRDERDFTLAKMTEPPAESPAELPQPLPAAPPSSPPLPPPGPGDETGLPAEPDLPPLPSALGMDSSWDQSVSLTSGTDSPRPSVRFAKPLPID